MIAMYRLHLLALSNDHMWLVYALAAITIIYIIARPMLRKKRDPLEKMPTFSLAQQRAVEREMSNLLVELSEMTRQVTAQLDTRSAKLEALIDEADRRIAELKRLDSGQAAPLQQPREQVASEEAAMLSPAVPRSQPDQRYMEIYTLADQGRSPQEIAQQLSRPQGEVELILALRMR